MAALVYIHSLVSTVKGAVSTGVLRMLLFHFSHRYTVTAFVNARSHCSLPLVSPYGNKKLLMETFLKICYNP
jgi:hypothetical protein